MKQRIITGVSAGVLFLLVAVLGGYPFILLAVILALIGYLEFLRMRKISPFSLPAIFGFILVILIASPYRFDWMSEDEWILVGFLLLLACTVLSKNVFHFDQAAFILLSALYVAFGFHYLIEARLPDNGLGVLFFVLLLIWSTDSGAYFVGRTFGRRKLWPDISPNKTVEGAFGGIIAAVIIAALFQLIFPVYTSMGIALFAAVVIAVFGQIGDLVESALKRHYGVKDSGNLLPGHGGILDRCDSWLFVLPILHFLHFI